MAAQQPRPMSSNCRPTEQAVGVIGVFGTGRQMPAMKAYERGKREPIDFDKSPAGKAWAFGGKRR